MDRRCREIIKKRWMENRSLREGQKIMAEIVTINEVRNISITKI